MRVLTFEPNAFEPEFRSRRYLHAKGGVAPSLLEYAREQQLAFENEPHTAPFRECAFELPDADKTLSELFDHVSVLCGLDRTKMTLSACELKGYGEGVSPDPSLHKDRLASEVSIGIPLRVAAASRVAIYPDRDLDPNPFVSSRLWQLSLDPADMPQVRLHDVPAVELDVQVGDAVVFQGSRAYHGRTHAAGSTILYIQLNALRLDPWKADPSTARNRWNGLALFDRLRDDEWLEARVELSPRLNEIRRVYTRDGWKEITFASVYQERDFRISELALRIITAMDGKVRVRELFDRVFMPSSGAGIAELRRLVRYGAVDLLEPIAAERDTRLAS